MGWLVTGIYPAKEGLKQKGPHWSRSKPGSYRHLSSKRRIETLLRCQSRMTAKKVTGIYPAKEGLKHWGFAAKNSQQRCYRHLSSKRRIETNYSLPNYQFPPPLPAFIQQKKDWNEYWIWWGSEIWLVTGIYPAKEGLKQCCLRAFAICRACYRHLSSKRRIETIHFSNFQFVTLLLPAFIQQKKDWNS